MSDKSKVSKEFYESFMRHFASRTPDTSSERAAGTPTFNQSDNILGERNNFDVPQKDKLYELGCDMQGLDNELCRSEMREKELKAMLKEEQAIKKEVNIAREAKRKELLAFVLRAGPIGGVVPTEEFLKSEQSAAAEKFLKNKTKRRTNNLD